MTDQPTRYLLVLEAKPDPRPPAARLRRFLKAVLRAAGFRCIEVREITTPATGPEIIPSVSKGESNV